MYFEPKTMQLRDGRTALLRTPSVEDAQGMLDYLKTACSETDFLLRSAEECDSVDVEGEAKWLKSAIDDPDCMMIAVEIDGEIAGNCEIRFNHRAKTHHRAAIGIGLKQRFWGMGIGSQLFRMMIDEARQREGVRIVELEFVEGNSRARALYEKMGFRIVSMRPDAFIRKDGSLCAEYYMQLKL